MVRCKIKGTGKKRWYDGVNYCNDESGCGKYYNNKNSTVSIYKDKQAKQGNEAKHWVSSPDGRDDGLDHPAMDREDALWDLPDDDVLSFDGTPFPSSNTKTDDDHAIQKKNDMFESDSSADVEPLPFMVPPAVTYPALLRWGSDLIPMDDYNMLPTNPITNNGVVPQPPEFRYSRSIILDETYDIDRNVSISIQNSISKIEIVHPTLQPCCDSTPSTTIRGVFDHHVYANIHSYPYYGTTTTTTTTSAMVYHYNKYNNNFNDYQPSKNPTTMVHSS